MGVRMRIRFRNGSVFETDNPNVVETYPLAMWLQSKPPSEMEFVLKIPTIVLLAALMIDIAIVYIIVRLVTTL